MRITLQIDDDLLNLARVHGAATGRTLDELVDAGLRLLLVGCPDPALPLVTLPTFGGTGVLGGVTLGDGPTLRESMDDGCSIDSLR
jgi:hypothetical protein